jgi:hypothetical protein
VRQPGERRRQHGHGGQAPRALDHGAVRKPQREERRDEGPRFRPVGQELAFQADRREQQARAQDGKPRGDEAPEEEDRHGQCGAQDRNAIPLEEQPDVDGGKQGERGRRVRRDREVVRLEGSQRPPLRQGRREPGAEGGLAREVRVVPDGRAERQEVPADRGPRRHHDEQAQHRHARDNEPAQGPPRSPGSAGERPNGARGLAAPAGEQERGGGEAHQGEHDRGRRHDVEGGEQGAGRGDHQ